MVILFVLVIVGILSGGNLHAVVKWRAPESGIWIVGGWAVGVNRLTRRRCHVLVMPVRACRAVGV